MPTRLLLGFLLFCLAGSAQTISPYTWKDIETAISSRKNLETNAATLVQLKQRSLAAGNDADIARCFYYLELIADQKTEDSLYFKNFRAIDSMLQRSSPRSLLKAILHTLKAKRILGFKNRFFYAQNKARINSYDARLNYSAMDIPQLNEHVRLHYDSALALAASTAQPDIESLLWISSDPLVFLFRPVLTDIIYGEIINTLGHYRRQIEIPSYGLALPQDSLLSFVENSVPDAEVRADLALYKQWMLYHGKANPQAYYFIETLARKHLYNSLRSDTIRRKLYEDYLQRLLTSPYAGVKATAVYQLCSKWNLQGGAYNADLRNFSYNGPEKIFDSTYRLSYVKALQLMDDYNGLLDSFPFIKSRLLQVKESIVKPWCYLSSRRFFLPGDTIPAFLQFRNIRQLYTRIIKISPSVTEDVTFTANSEKKRDIKRFLQLPYIEENIQQLPALSDYQVHNTVLKLGSLRAGRYIILYSDSMIGAGRMNYLDITVTRIAVINNDQRVFVLDRETGFPLENATVIEISKKASKKGSPIDTWAHGRPKKVNKDGYIIADIEKSFSLEVIYNNDTIHATPNEPNEETSEYIYNKDDYEDISEYYEENIKVIMFTDRSIYRPGQTVYFKGIFVTRNPKTGEPLVLNWKNLKVPFYKKLLYKAMRKLSGTKIEFYILDPFDHEQDTISVLPNKYGSVAGSFKIPKTAATGKWSFDTDDFDIDNNNTSEFSVEEYKRPSFELTIQKPTKELYLLDSFAVKLKVRSFAGASLSNVLVKYTVQRNGYMPLYDSVSGFTKGNYITKEIVDEEGYTNDNGELIIRINDSTLREYKFDFGKRQNVHYNIEAEAIDATGESHEQDLDIDISNRPVQINIPIGVTIDRSNLSPIYISAKSQFAGALKKTAEITVYRVPAKPKPGGRQWPLADVWLHPKQQVWQWLNLSKEESSPQKLDEKIPVYKTTLLIGDDDKLLLPKEILQSGHYIIEVVCKERGQVTGEASKPFSVFDRQSGTLPETTSSFHYMPANSVDKGGEVVWLSGNSQTDIFSIYHLSWYEKSGKAVRQHFAYDLKPEKKGMNEWRYKLPAGAIERVLLTHLYIINNELFSKEENVYVSNSAAGNPEIVVEQYRKKLSPGASETFSVSIKTKDENTAAELMTTMYDASLDKLEPHEWRVPYFDRSIRMRSAWDKTINGSITSQLYNDDSGSPYYSYSSRQPLWWINPSGGYDYSLKSESDNDAGMFLKRMPGVQVSEMNQLNDVVVVGYGTVKKSLTASMSGIYIRGNTSLAGYTNTLIILDGEIYTGDIGSINTTTITEALVLKGADATSLYGSRAANGVLVISTKGPVKLPSSQEALVPPVIRKNFAETAFFYPQVHAGRNGIYTIHFTVPESVTEWKWKMMAHTKKAAFTYTERSIFTQLPLMVQPSMPRFLYQGDRIILKSRITNMDSIAMTGKLQCMIEDVVTGENITGQLMKDQQQPFTVQGNANGGGAFEIIVPSGMLHPLKIKIVAATSTFSDGEEHIIPVLAKKILVSQAVRIDIRGAKQAIVNTPSLPADAEPYGLSLYIRPQSSSAMINALPYLAGYPHGCAEQIFNKMLAHAVAIKMMRTDTALQNMFEDKRPVPGNPLPEELDEQAMPWLQLLHANTLQQQKLHLLMDTSRAWEKVDEYLTLIKTMQHSDGGITWFKGGPSSEYISSYILAGFGKMIHDQLPLEKNPLEKRVSEFISKLVGYCDNRFVSGLWDAESLQYLQARSYWLASQPLPGAARNKLDSLLSVWWKKADSYGIGRQALLISATLRYSGGTGNYQQLALQQLESIRQQAISDDGSGTRWKAVADQDDLNTLTEELIVNIAEAFETAGQSKETVKGIIKWLLQEKNDHEWSSTRSTAAVVSLLHRQQQVAMPAQQMRATINNTTLQVTDNLVAGSPYAFVQQAETGFPSTITVQKSNTQPGAGAINYYYFTAHPLTDSSANVVRIGKQLRKYNAGTQKWDTLRNGEKIAIADKINVTITIDAPRFLPYVFISDSHAAGLEPTDASSGYEYGTGFSYYKSVRDAGFQFFAEKIPSGISTISYEMVVSAEGDFNNGPASLQCMYQPAVRAYSSSVTIVAGK
jgi:alpha-2-macroglobulin